MQRKCTPPPNSSTIPYGYCHCGCGQKTNLARQTVNALGYVAGQPLRFVHGHNKVKSYLDPNALEKRCTGCGKTLPLSFFGVKSSATDGRANLCKHCNREYYRRYYKKNKDVLRERMDEWSRMHPEVRAAAKRNRIARERGAHDTITQAEWQSVLEAYGDKCLKCGSMVNIEMDHVVPLSRGGTHTVDNVQPLCAPCNRKKATSTRDYRTFTALALPLD